MLKRTERIQGEEGLLSDSLGYCSGLSWPHSERVAKTWLPSEENHKGDTCHIYQNKTHMYFSSSLA